MVIVSVLDVWWDGALHPAFIYLFTHFSDTRKLLVASAEMLLGTLAPVGHYLEGVHVLRQRLPGLRGQPEDVGGGEGLVVIL